MDMKKKPVTGMKDIMPDEMEIRNHVMNAIKEVYESYGFVNIETPAIEHIANLSGKLGGENEKLIFRILKRGEKLKLDQAKTAEDLVDSGLRYDLTLPLSRYYSNHANELPIPFKALQMGNVWRADRPQRGRFRQFVQCDIDIIGEAGCIAESELLLAGEELLYKVGFNGFTIRINDRRVLYAVSSYCGFEENERDEVLIILDKLDKIGIDGIRECLEEAGYKAEATNKCCELFENFLANGMDMDELASIVKDHIEEGVFANLKTIMKVFDDNKKGSSKIIFDPTLVRGMGYYTGPIFEISMEGFSGSVGGGGRYDEMIGRFTKSQVPACGFSIGFERIIMLLMESGRTFSKDVKRRAYLIDKKVSDDKMEEVVGKATEDRKEGMAVTICTMKKNKKFQKEMLKNQGYDDIVEVFAD